VSVSIENQITHEKSTANIPVLEINGQKALNNDRIVESIVKKLGGTSTIFQRIPQGLLRISTTIVKKDGEKAVGTYIPPSSEVYKSIVQGKPYIGRAYVVNGWYITGYHPLFGRNNQVIGAVYVGVPEINKAVIRQNTTDIRIGETGYFFILDGNGEVVIHPNPELEGSSLLNTPGARGKMFAQEMIKKKKGSVSYYWKNVDEVSAREKIAFYDYFEKLDWIIASSVYIEDLNEPVIELRNIMIIIVIGALILIILLVTVIANSISKPVSKITEQLEQTADHTASGAEQVSSSSQELSSGASQLASSVEEITSSMEELQSTIESNHKNMDEAREMMKDNKKNSQQVSSWMKEMEKSMEEINENSEKIRNIINVIEDISFQTNILSLNASVEAARAGDAGRGFAVVANQVKELAGRSSQAAGETAQLIERATSSVKEGLEVTHKVSEVQESALELADKLNVLLGEVKKNSEEQLKGAQQVTSGVTQVNSVVQQTASSSEELAASAEELQSQSEELKKVVQQLNKLVQGEGKESTQKEKKKEKKG
jgi:methyl-accepting chemotaxis protein